MSDQLEHLPTCEAPDVREHAGYTTTYVCCRSCGAEAYWRKVHPTPRGNR